MVPLSCTARPGVPVLLSLADIGLSRIRRLLLVMGGLAIYALFCLGLARYG